MGASTGSGVWGFGTRVESSGSLPSAADAGRLCRRACGPAARELRDCGRLDLVRPDELQHAPPLGRAETEHRAEDEDERHPVLRLGGLAPEPEVEDEGGG